MGYWQERAVLAVDLLNMEENKMQCALLVLKVSPVPWSEVVNPLIVLGNSSHPLANSIFIEYKSQAIKMIKVKYNWPLDYFDLYNDRMKLVFRILKLTKPDMVQDIQVLVKSSPDISQDAYHYLINRLTELGDFEKCVEVIKSVEDSNELCMRSLAVFIAKLDRNEVEQKDLENYLEIVGV